MVAEMENAVIGGILVKAKAFFDILRGHSGFSLAYSWINSLTSLQK